MALVMFRRGANSMQRAPGFYRFHKMFSSPSSAVRLCSGLVGAPSAAVTRHNFVEALEQLKVHLRTADYVALDMEMSGVHSAPWRRSMELDTLETRYQNLRDSAEKFSVFQCGVCLFRYDKETSKFMAYPYNFYLFPRNELPFDTPSRDFLCQTSSLEFLAKHQFDFNACIYNGISYLSEKQERIARAQMARKAEAGSQEEMIPEIAMHRTSDVIFCERVRLEVGLWRSAKIMAKHQKQSTDLTTDWKSLENVLPSLIVNITDKRQAKLVVQAVKKNFNDLVPMLEDSAGDAKQVKVIYTGSEEHKALVEANLTKERTEKVEATLLEAVGFRHVIDALAESQKPIVGHNCILDFAHIHSKFIGPLPESYSNFCSTVHQHFPCIIDTKYMLKAEPTVRDLGISGTSLAPVYSYFFGAGSLNAKKGSKNKTFPRVKVEVADDFQRYFDVELKHEAGFDAYMTGAVFAQIWRLARSNASEIHSLAEQIKLGRFGIAHYANLLYLGWAGHYVLDLTTGEEATGTKALPERLSHSPHRPLTDAAVLVWSQSSVGSSRHLKKLVKSCFAGTQFSPDVEVIAVDENSAFLVFKSLDSMEEIVHAYDSIKSNPNNQQTPVATKLAATGLKVARFETFEKLCKSPLSTRKLADSIERLKECSEEEDDEQEDELDEFSDDQLEFAAGNLTTEDVEGGGNPATENLHAATSHG